MAFVKLTCLDNRFVYINSTLIESIVPHFSVQSSVFITGDRDNYWVVLETPEEIIELIKQANNG